MRSLFKFPTHSSSLFRIIIKNFGQTVPLCICRFSYGPYHWTTRFHSISNTGGRSDEWRLNMSPDCHFLSSNVKSTSFLSIAAPFMMHDDGPFLSSDSWFLSRMHPDNFDFSQFSQRRSVVTSQLFTWRMPRLVPCVHCFLSLSCTVKNHHCIRSIVRCSYVFEFLFLNIHFFELFCDI